MAKKETPPPPPTSAGPNTSKRSAVQPIRGTRDHGVQAGQDSGYRHDSVDPKKPVEKSEHNKTKK